MVFPTCVGVFQQPCVTTASWVCLPHVRGGVSDGKAVRFDRKLSSPRAWGCFHRRSHHGKHHGVFPTCVGVFLVVIRGSGNKRRSSPRAWGCFQKSLYYFQQNKVFPTCVGVFPSTRMGGRGCRGLPHVRGGVSQHPVAQYRQSESSPRAWGCFSGPFSVPTYQPVFPTCVGVFLHRF